ncbi:hypothetical protein [Aurantibacillus circumpalustris]|uniref:hypothetical protein n=1 Tax=Aurantibacillus circumpalustris TaxID=3036359 RepID=UPI00295BD6C6|nr:hypothetical protein [Aurantibacillus circumpalustris]
MKKAVLFVLALILLSAITNAGVPDKVLFSKKSLRAQDGVCYDEHTHLLNFGVGFGSFYNRGIGTGFSSSTSPAFSVSYEQAYPKKLGPGYLGVGAYVGFITSYSRNDNYNNTTYYYEHRWNYMMIAARGVYHWDVLNFKKGDIYGGVLIGVRITTYTYKSNSNDPNINIYKRNDAGVLPAGSVFAGARWYLTKNIAVFGEAGYGVSLLNGGITLKW